MVEAPQKAPKHDWKPSLECRVLLAIDPVEFATLAVLFLWPLTQIELHPPDGVSVYLLLADGAAAQRCPKFAVAPGGRADI
jgi:hypothetical protein